MSRNCKIIILAILIGIIFFSVHFAVIFKKGYPATISGAELVLARNYGLGLGYKFESQQNIILSTNRVAQEGIESDLGNKLTSILYSWIFKFFGFKENLPLYTTLLLFAITCSLLFFLVYKLFGFWSAAIFGLLSIFIPIIWQYSLLAGAYEFSLLFFTLGLLMYFLSAKQRSHFLLLVSLFFALSVLSRNSLFISFIPLVLFEYYKNRNWKRLSLLIIPFIIAVGLFLAYNQNAYLGRADDSFFRYGHLFPDPYTYHFEKDSYLEKIIDSAKGDEVHFLMKYGQSVDLRKKVDLIFDSLIFYPKDIFRIITFGGPIFILLTLFGLWSLRKSNQEIFLFFIFWFFVWYGVLAILGTSNSGHLIQLWFPIVVSMALGLDYLLKQLLKTSLKKIYLALIILFIAGQLIFASKWMFHEEYTTNQSNLTQEIIDKLKRADLDKNDVVAMNHHPTVAVAVNYYTNANIIYFSANTINKLIKDDNLQQAFEKFGVNKVVGFDLMINEYVNNLSGIEIIE